MDRKSLIILAACFASLVFLPHVLDRIFPPIPVPVSTNVVAQATNTIRPGMNAPVAANPSAPIMTSDSARYVVSTNVPEQLLVVSNHEARYTFTSRGGGLQFVELTGYRENVSTRRTKDAQTNAFATLNSAAVPPVLAILGSEGESLQGDGSFTLQPIPNGVRAEKVLSNGLAIMKEFRIGTNYLMSADVRLENRTKGNITLPQQAWIAGAATPMGPDDKGQAVGVLWYSGSKLDTVSVPYFSTNRTTFFVFPRTPKAEYHAGESNVVWVAAQNQFFTLALMVTNPAPAVSVRMVELPAPAQEDKSTLPANPEPKGLEAAILYPATSLAAGQVVERHFDLFAGPKEYRTLARLASQLNNDLDHVMGFTGFWGTCAKPLLMAMNWLHRQVGMAYGWAIIVITIIIKAVFWPLTQYSTRTAKRMQALQPQMKALQEKYKDDPSKLSQKQMEFWKQNKVNPMSGCLPAFVQIPVFGGFYRMLQSAIELRDTSFLWVRDLSKPDTLFHIPLPLPLPGFGYSFPVNPMPLIMGASMLWQARLTPPAPGMDPAQQKMMRYLPLIMLVFLYNFSSGLALYWTINNLLTVLQTWLTRTKPETAPAAVPAVAPVKKKKSN